MDKFTQTYSQAPWRKQLQFIGLFSLILIFVALIAGIYLSVSARAATVGRNIQVMQRDIEKLDMEIENLQSQLALIESMDEMEKRADELGFKLVQVDEILYLKIDGYVEPQPVVLAPYERAKVTGARALPARFTEDLFTWIKRQVVQISIPSVEAEP
jgi:cell division protein FtsL